MEVVSQATSAAATAVQKVSETVSEKAGAATKSIPSPGAGIQTSGFSNFHPFDPTVFEKSPTEFGAADPFKDTFVVAKNETVSSGSKPKMDFSSFSIFTPKEPIPEEQVEKFDFIDFNFLFTQRGVQEAQIEAKSALHSVSNVSQTSTLTESEYDFGFEKMVAGIMAPDEVSHISKTEEQTKTEPPPEYFESLTIVDIEAKTATTDEEIQTEIIGPEAEEEDDEKVQTNRTSIDNEEDERNDNSEEPKEETEPEETMEEYDPETQVDSEEEEEDSDELKPDPRARQLIHVVDEKAQNARIEEAFTSVDEVDSYGGLISGSRVLELMHKTATPDQISEVLEGTEYTDGSDEEVRADIEKINPTNPSRLKEKILEIVKNKPAIMLSQAGQTVDDIAVDRVYKYVRNSKGTVLDSVHT